MGPQNTRRPPDKHLSEEELNALVPSSLGGNSTCSADAVREATRHLMGCEDCSRNVSLYRLLSTQQSPSARATPAVTDCPKDEDVDWHEVAAGLWPELKAKQLLLHAAQCGHCGPLLRAALCVDEDPTPEEESFLTQLKKPARPEAVLAPVLRARPGWQIQFARWATPIAALALIVGVFRTRAEHSPHILSGPEFDALAANTYRQQTQGILALDVHAESQQQLNEWFKAKSQLPVVLPSPSSMPPGDEEPRVEGARLLPMNDRQTAAYVAYEMRTGPVGLMVTPDSVAVASGGSVANFKTVSFHYNMVQGYKVVTWSIHGLTYGLVSREGNHTQQSCMVCHSAMRDRDLTHTPTPLHDGKVIQPLEQ
jgi:hypothetical protein